VLNAIIGTGVFVLPGTIAGMLGWSSMLAWALAAGFTAAMILCFAEVASRFTEAGGAYLYAEAAYGRFFGIQMGWMIYFARCISAAVQANLFTTYLAEFWPWVETQTGTIVVSTLFIGLLAAINIRGVGTGARVSDVFATIKAVPLLLFGLLGIAWLMSGKAATPAIASDPTMHGWLQALLLLMFAYGGFESALIPLGEAKDPRRDAPFALLFGIGLVTAIYLAVQVTVLATLSDPAMNNRPLAESARVMLGTTGAVVITIAAMISVYGWMASNMLMVPRLTMAMAQRGDLPKVFGRIHKAFRTPWVSIVVFAVVSLFLALQAGLLQNLTLSAVSRLLPYGAICLALPVFRRRDRTAVGESAAVSPALFRAPAGMLMSVIGMVVAVVLTTRMSGREAIAMTIVVAVATIHWASIARGRSGRTL
jgi:amino acid transporter